MVKAVTVLMDEDLRDAAKEVLTYYGLSMSSYVRRRMTDLIADWAEDLQSHKYDALLKRYVGYDNK